MPAATAPRDPRLVRLAQALRGGASKATNPVAFLQVVAFFGELPAELLPEAWNLVNKARNDDLKVPLIAHWARLDLNGARACVGTLQEKEKRVAGEGLAMVWLEENPVACLAELGRTGDAAVWQDVPRGEETP